MPCVHACATMHHTHQPPATMICDWFSKAKFADTYRGNIRPLNGSRMWARTPYAKPLPPPARRMPGRPKTNRMKHVIEKEGDYRKLRAVGGTKVCTNCWEKGHNKRTCKNSTRPKPPQEKKKMGFWFGVFCTPYFGFGDEDNGAPTHTGGLAQQPTTVQ